MTIIIIILIFLFGGCGVSMDLFHSDPLPPIEATPTPSAEGGVCTLTIRQAPENSSTRIPPTGENNGAPLNIQVAYCMNLGTLLVGDEWQLRVRAIDMGLAVYYLTITNDDGEELTIRYNPTQPANFEFSSNLSALTMVSATTYNQWETIFTLTSTAVDVVEISLYASGEVHYGYSGPASWTITPTETFFLAINE